MNGLPSHIQLCHTFLYERVADSWFSLSCFVCTAGDHTWSFVHASQAVY